MIIYDGHSDRTKKMWTTICIFMPKLIYHRKNQ